MPDDHEFRVRPGRIRSTRAQSARPFIAQALAAAKKAGGVSRSGRIVSANRSRFGRGQRASIQANRFITARTRSAVIKARVVRHSGRSAPLGTHLDYLRRDGVTRDGEKARLFEPETQEADGRAFAEAMDARRQTNQRLGVLLIERGLLTPAQVYQAIRQQIEGIVWSLFDWPDGEIRGQVHLIG